jgi:nickel transport protein
MIKLFRTIPLLLLAFTIAATAVGTIRAHGTEIIYQVEDGIVIIDAIFDSGEPMANAQIVAYAPDNPSDPYYQGITDENGHIAFPIDPAITGSWDISVRTAGHGEMLHIPVDSSTTSLINAGNESRSQSQTIMLAGGVVVILGGIALYFMRSKQTDARS